MEQSRRTHDVVKDQGQPEEDYDTQATRRASCKERCGEQERSSGEPCGCRRVLAADVSDERTSCDERSAEGSGTDALQGAVHILNALHALNADYLHISSKVEGISHPYLNVGQISGGTNTNVLPGKVVFKLDRRMIPEENPVEVEASIRQTIQDAAASFNPPRGGKLLKIDIKRILLAKSMVPLAGNKPLVDAIQKHGEHVFGEPIPAVGTPLYTDVRLYVERGIPGVIYGAGPRTVRESNAKRADEHVQLEDVRRATKVVARTLLDLLN